MTRTQLETLEIRTVFFYPPSHTYAEDPDAWWSWPGNDFDAEGRQQEYVAELRNMGQRLGLDIRADDGSTWTGEQTDALVQQLEADPPGGLLIVLFANHSRGLADRLSAAAEKLGIPVVYYIALGVTHGPGPRFRQYRREGLHFIMSLENFDAIERGLRLIRDGKPLGQGPWPDGSSGVADQEAGT